MHLTINGQSKNIDGAGTIAELVGRFCSNTKAIITEVNGTIIPKTDWQKTPLKDGDTVELVSFVGGG